MDGTVIPLPLSRAHPAVVRPAAVREQVAVLSIELGLIDGRAPALPVEILSRIHERCVRAALVVAGRHGAKLALAGTSAHPVIEARFRGAGAEDRALEAALGAARSVNDAQRLEERCFASYAGLALGTTTRTDAGIRVTTGSPARVAELLRERAGSGQVLLGGDGWADLADELEATAGSDLALDAGSSIPVWSLVAATTDDD